MKVLVLAGGYDQIGLINELKSRGHYVILADYFENPPAKKVADKHYQASTLDEDAIYEIASKEQVELITTACTDQALLTVAKVSERLGLPCYISYEKGLQVTNKKYMKEKFLKIGVPTAQCVILKNMDDMRSVFERLTYPMVVKPSDCNSSKGVIKVEDEKELLEAVKNAFSLSRSHLVIVEEFVEGQEVSIDVWVDTEGAKVLSVSETEKIESSKEVFTIYKSKYPVGISEVAKEKIQMIANTISQGFELYNCPLLIQAIVDSDDVRVIEFSARMGGGTKYKLIEYMASVEIMKAYVNRVLGDEEQIVKPIISKDYIELNYVYATNGVFDKLVNFEELKKSNEIADYYQYKESGAIIEKAATSSDRIAGFLLIAKTEDDLKNKRREVLTKLDVLDSTGKSMMWKSIYGG